MLDLGLTGRRALVCGSSAGLGYACAAALADAGVDVTINGRSIDRLEEATDRIERRTGVRPGAVVANVATVEGRATLIENAGVIDILVTNTGGPPAGDFREFGEEEWLTALRANMLSAIFLIGAVIDPMISRKWGRIINITSAAVKAPIGNLPMSNAARSGLTGFTAGLARDVARHGITVNNLLPGYFATERFNSYVRACGLADGSDPGDVLNRMIQATPARRIGDPDEFGAWCAFLASRHSGFVTGQNLLLDGGSYPGML